MDRTKTYLTGFGWLNMIAIIDRYDRTIAGYEISPRGRAIEWLTALDKVLMSRFPEGVRDKGHLILQTDNGCQPTSRKFTETVAKCDVELIYTAMATPEHHTHIALFFRTLKEEEIWPNLYDIFSEAMTSIED
jgi:putative transposase